MIERVDPDRITEADLTGWHECRVAANLADFPDDPPPTRDRVTMYMVSGAGVERRVWLARDPDGRVVGEALLELFGQENPHLGALEVTVRPDARRAGLGRALYETASADARDAGRTTLLSDTVDAPVPVGFATALGFARAQSEVRRVLRLPEVDLAEISRLAAGAGAKTAGFSLRRWTDACPDDLLDGYAAACEAMNDAPIGELDMRPWRWTGDRVRDLERTRAIMRRPVHTQAAVEDATGTVAGYTEVLPWVGSPRADQSDTTVIPAYRGRGFGLWLKAAMIEWLRAECPWVSEYETWNAADNPHMIAVNDRLGYRPVDTWIDWQRKLDGDDR